VTAAATPAPRPAAADADLAGTRELTKIWLRRDRIMLPAWIYLLTATMAGTLYSFKSLYDTPGSRAGLVDGVNASAATRALAGPVLGSGSVAGLAAWKVGVTGGVLVAVMSVLLVVRHTRAEEESGRLELLGATVVGRRAPLTAGILVALAADAVLAVVVPVSSIVLGAPVAGSFAFGLSWAACGLVFTTAAAVAAQLTETSRSANGLALGLLGVAYGLRAIADAGPRFAWMTWLSPLGWSEQVRAFGGDRWWVLLLPLAAAAALGTGAYVLLGRRDHGAGVLSVGLGPAEAARSFRSTSALARRLQRGLLVSWAAGFLIYGFAVGSVADGLDAMVGTSRATRTVLAELGGSPGLVDSFLATDVGIMALLAAACAVQVVLRLRAEETGGRLELLLATRATRTRWALGHLAVAAAGSAALLALYGLSSGLAYGISTSDVGGEVPRQLGAALVQVPAVWTVAATAVLLFGFVPRAVPAAWGVLAAVLLLGQLGPVLKLPQWAMDLSPFSHVPKLPGGHYGSTPLLWLTLVAVALCAAGLVGLRRRDLG